MALLLAIGVGVAGLAIGSRFAVQIAKNMKGKSMKQIFPFAAASKGVIPRTYYKGGFETEMTRMEAALILGVRLAVET